jgi:hypothetical protein
VPSTRQELRRRLRLSANPQLMLRAGIAPPTAPTPRRPLVDVIRVADDVAPS